MAAAVCGGGERRGVCAAALFIFRPCAGGWVAFAACHI